MRLMGIPVIEQDIATIIDRLQQVGRAEDLELAGRVARASISKRRSSDCRPPNASCCSAP
jgi:hypothetical protein